jgi:hypothetical protein
MMCSLLNSFDGERSTVSIKSANQENTWWCFFFGIFKRACILEKVQAGFKEVTTWTITCV